MALHLIEISWQRQDPRPDQALTGTTDYAEFARTLTAAITKAKTKFNRHYGMHRAITGATEKPQTASV